MVATTDSVRGRLSRRPADERVSSFLGLGMDRKSARERGYDTRWDKARKWYLRHHPLCRYCTREGKIEAAIVVDHIKPHKGNMVLFWDQDNWQPLCKPHHDSTKRREEHGKSHGCDENGNPLGGWAA